MNTISIHLTHLARENGYHLGFRQLPCGLWRVFRILPGRTQEIWTGSLVEAFRIAKGIQ